MNMPAWLARTALPALLLLLAPLALLWPSVIGNEVFLPFSAARFPPFRAELSAERLAAVEAHPNYDVTEVPVTFIPELTFARDELAAGRLPHWNPYARFGASLLATSVVGLMYPPNWLTFLAIDPTIGLALNAYLALAIAGLLMFGFLRALGLGPLAATYGALALALSGTLTANLHFYQRIHALIWLPGMLWAAHAIAHREGRRRRLAGVGLAVCMALAWLAGFPSYAAAATLVVGGYGAVLTLVALRLNGLRAGRPVAGVLALCAVAGLLLAAAQLLPMFAFFPESNRDPDPPRDNIANQAFDPIGMAGYVLPDPFGTPARPAQPPYDNSPVTWRWFSRRSWDTGVPFAPNYNFVEYTVYPGALTLLLAVLGLCAGAGWFRWCAAGLLGVLWLLGFAGDATASVSSLPFLRSVPPMRFLGPACVLVAALAAIGLEALPKLVRGAWFALGAGACLALTIACTAVRIALGAQAPDAWLAHHTPALIEHYRPRFPNASPELVQGLLGQHAAPALELLRANLAYGAIAFALVGGWLVLARALARYTHATRWLAGVALLATGLELAALGWQVNRGRPNEPLVSSALDFLRNQRNAHAGDGGASLIRAAPTASHPSDLPPVLTSERIRDLHNYTFVDARSHRLFVALYGPDHMLRSYWPQSFPDDERLRRPLFDALGVRHVLATQELRHAGPLVHEVRRPGGNFFIYERPTALPRAFVVPALHAVADEPAVIAAMVATEFDPRAAALTTPASGLDPAHGQPGAGARTVTFSRDTPTELTLRVAAGPAGYLVLSDSMMQGWTATIADQPAPLARGNLFMRVVPIPAGTVEVHMQFATPRLILGIAVTSLTAVALLAFAYWPRRRSPPRPAPVEQMA